MTTYTSPNLAASSRSIGNLDGTSAGIGGTDTVRIQSGTGNFLQTDSSIAASSTPATTVSFKLQNVGTGAGVFVRKEADNVTFSLRRLLAGSNVSIIEQGDSILFSSVNTGVDRFVNLLDVPDSFVGSNGKYLTVDESNSRLIFSSLPNLVTSFTGLTDTPDTYVGYNNQYLKISGNQIIFSNIPDPIVNFLGLTDTPDTYVGNDGKFVIVDATNQDLKFGTPSFLGLSDTPSTYTNSNGKFLSVDSTNGKIIFQDIVIPPQSNKITFSDTPPSSASQGDGWWDTVDGGFYLYYQDSDSGQWIESGASEPAVVPSVSMAYDYGAFFEGSPKSNEIIYNWRAPRDHTLDDDFAGSLFACGTNPTANFTCGIWINGSQVGTWSIDINGNSTLVSNTTGTITIPAYQEIKIIGPSLTDASIADLVISFKGERF